MLELGHTFVQSVERSPDALAIVDGDVRLTYSQWHERILRVAQGLADLGLRAGDHLVVMSQNRWEMATLHWACQFLGVIVTPLNWRAKADEAQYCMSKFDAGAALAHFERERLTCLYLVPTLYHDLLHHPAFSPARVATVRKLGFAGAPMPEPLVHRLRTAFAPELFVNHYGSSEIYTFTVDQDASAKPGSAGKAGLNVRVRVVKLDARSPEDLTEPREEGQIITDMQGDEAFSGYWKRPDVDAKALRHGWYFTGDTGYVDVDGDLFVTGRVDDMIISGGENISPVEIESILSLHPAVDEVAVVGLRDERWGQRVVAFVKRRSAVDAAALDHHCRASELVNFKRPREYVFVRQIPKSPVGKLLRRKLVAGEYEPEPSFN